MAAEVMIALKILEIANVAAPWIAEYIKAGREVEVATALATLRPRTQQALENEVDQAELPMDKQETQP
jgi:hypothetical protein